MPSHLDTLRAACDATLIAGLPESLKASIRDALAAGGKPSAIKRIARKHGRKSLTYLGVCAYLDQLKEEK